MFSYWWFPVIILNSASVFNVEASSKVALLELDFLHIYGLVWHSRVQTRFPDTQSWDMMLIDLDKATCLFIGKYWIIPD